MVEGVPTNLSQPVDPVTDHILGPADAEITLVEYGSYACGRSRDVHAVVEALRSRFGARMRYVFRHLPRSGTEKSVHAAELAEYAHRTTDKFWEIHQALIERGWALSLDDCEQIRKDLEVPELDDPRYEAEFAAARTKVADDMRSAKTSGALVTPTFFINGRRYSGAWDESSLTDAILAPLGHRIQSAAFNFVRWGPSSGLLLLLAVLIALGFSNSPAAASFAGIWEAPFGFQLGPFVFTHSLLHWVNHLLLSVFFFVVGLEIKREFTVGHLSTFRSSTLPVIAAAGGIILPALIYAGIAPAGLRHGWGIPIGTDTAFAVALIVLLRERVPIELRVFLTAAVIIDDIVAILLIALFYTEQIHGYLLIASAAVSGIALLFNRSGVYNAIPYAVCAVVLWFFLHEAGLHATLAAVIMAMLIPTRPPANLTALLSQASAVIQLENARAAEAMHPGPSEFAMRTLDAIHKRIESPADKLLRSVEPWSSYEVLPIFALANAGVEWSAGVLEGNTRLILAIMLGLVLGKPLGILLGALAAVRTGIAVKPDVYSWRQLCGAGALGGIGFTMSLFIAGVAFNDEADFAAAKIAVFLASLIAGLIGVLILWPKAELQSEQISASP